MKGLKAQLKEELRKSGVTHIVLDSGRKIKLQNAKTIELFKAVLKK